jgi:uncharacterized protein YgbK (DUF1537 family)
MIFAIADDLTGALEVGAKFAARGFSASVTYEDGIHADYTSVSVIDTETRHLPARQAAAKITALCANRPAPPIIYKKTDSTLRGNIAAELGALQAAFPHREIFYVPAYPAMGRTVRIGELLVDGIPLHRTAFANDPLNPITSSSIKTALGNVQAMIFDGETEADVLAAAKHIAGQTKPAIVAGPAAIAAALAEVLPSPESTQVSLPALKRCLVINGSLHPASSDQIQAATFDHDWKRFEYTGEQTGAERALRLGESVQRYLQQNPVDALLVFGGDTAYGIHRALGAQPFTSCGEALPGVPVSQAAGLYWITKAGGFGSSNLIEELRRKLSS